MSAITFYNAWAKALANYNSGKNCYCIPKRGTNEHEKVMKIRSELISKHMVFKKPVKRTEKKQNTDLVTLMNNQISWHETQKAKSKPVKANLVKLAKVETDAEKLLRLATEAWEKNEKIEPGSWGKLKPKQIIERRLKDQKELTGKEWEKWYPTNKFTLKDIFTRLGVMLVVFRDNINVYKEGFDIYNVFQNLRHKITEPTIQPTQPIRADNLAETESKVQPTQPSRQIQPVKPIRADNLAETESKVQPTQPSRQIQPATTYTPEDFRNKPGIFMKILTKDWNAYKKTHPISYKQKKLTPTNIIKLVLDEDKHKRSGYKWTIDESISTNRFAYSILLDFLRRNPYREFSSVMDSVMRKFGI